MAIRKHVTLGDTTADGGLSLLNWVAIEPSYSILLDLAYGVGRPKPDPKPTPIEPKPFPGTG
jgi:hypothetical protein